MEFKELTEMIQRAVDELHKAVERQDEAIKKLGEPSVENAASIVTINERLTELLATRDDLETKLQRATLPRATEVDGADGHVPSEEEKTRKDAFYKFIRHGVSGLEPAERKALVEDATGQYLIEPELDTEIVMALPKITVIRGLATVRPVRKDRLKMKSMGAVQVGWGKLETGTGITESTPMPGAPTYQHVEDLYALAKIGEDELEDSDINLEPILADLFSTALAEAEDLAFVRGPGHDSDQPEGICINSILTAATVTSSVAGAVTVEKFLEQVYTCPTQYRRSGQFIVHSTSELALRQLRAKTGEAVYEGAFLWQPSVQQGKPNTFLGYPIHTQDDMKELTDAAQVFSIFGDFKKGYRIIDRAGMTIQRLTELYSEAGLVGFKIHKRVGGAVMRADQKPLVLMTETT